MLKIYLESSFIWFIIFIAEGILFKKEFNEAQKKVNKKEIKKLNWFTTTIMYFIVSFIPIIRFLLFYGKVYMTFFTDSYIKTQKEMKEEKKNNGKRNEHKRANKN